MRPMYAPLMLGALTLGPLAPAAAGDLLESLVDPHTIRTVELRDRSQTQWTVALQPLAEADLVRFTDEDGAPIEPGAFRPVRDAWRYGFAFVEGADFDLAYALVARSHDGSAAVHGNPKCVFVFTALQPAVPENAVRNFARAACTLQRESDGSLHLVLDHH